MDDKFASLVPVLICTPARKSSHFSAPEDFSIHPAAHENWVTVANRVLLSKTYFVIYICIILLSLVTMIWVCAKVPPGRVLSPGHSEQVCMFSDSLSDRLDERANAVRPLLSLHRIRYVSLTHESLFCSLKMGPLCGMSESKRS